MHPSWGFGFTDYIIANSPSDFIVTIHFDQPLLVFSLDFLSNWWLRSWDTYTVLTYATHTQVERFIRARLANDIGLRPAIGTR